MIARRDIQSERIRFPGLLHTLSMIRMISQCLIYSKVLCGLTLISGSLQSLSLCALMTVNLYENSSPKSTRNKNRNCYCIIYCELLCLSYHNLLHTKRLMYATVCSFIITFQSVALYVKMALYVSLYKSFVVLLGVYESVKKTSVRRLYAYSTVRLPGVQQAKHLISHK